MSAAMAGEDLAKQKCQCLGNNCDSHSKCIGKTRYPCPKCGCCEICHKVEDGMLKCRN